MPVREKRPVTEDLALEESYRTVVPARTAAILVLDTGYGVFLYGRKGSLFSPWRCPFLQILLSFCRRYQ